MDSGQEATVSAQVAEATPSAEIASSDCNLQPETCNLNLTPPEILLATGSATLANLEVTSEATVSGMLAAYQAEIQDNFKVFGTTTLSNTLIAGTLSVDGTISIGNNSISSLGTLKLQDQILAGPIDIFNGKITLNPDGTLTIQKLVVSSTTLSSATITQGQTSVVIESDGLTANSKIFITPSRPVPIAVTSKDVINKNFTVELAEPEVSDITFDWWIVESKP